MVQLVADTPSTASLHAFLSLYAVVRLIHQFTYSKGARSARHIKNCTGKSVNRFIVKKATIIVRIVKVSRNVSINGDLILSCREFSAIVSH